MRLFYTCIKIFLARTIDVSLGTFVTILTVKNKRLSATIIGFFDVIIWFLAVKEALNININSFYIPLSYAGGYAIGTFIGTTLSNKIIKYKICVQVIIDYNLENQIDCIRKEGFAVSVCKCTGANNSKKLMLFIEIDKRKLKILKTLINNIDNKAFFIINESRYVENGFFK